MPLRLGLSRHCLWRYNGTMAKSNFMIGATTVAAIAATFVGLLTFQKIHALRQQGPLRIVFDRDAQTPLEAVLVRTARETTTAVFAHHPPVTRLAALHNAGVDVFDAEDGPRMQLADLAEIDAGDVASARFAVAPSVVRLSVKTTVAEAWPHLVEGSAVPQITDMANQAADAPGDGMLGGY